MASKYPRSSLKYLLVLDFEATCGNNITKPEIIEFPTLVYDLEQGKFTPERTLQQSLSLLAAGRLRQSHKHFP